MERLTMRNSDGSVSQPLDLQWAEALGRLADYEDTGLGPNEVKQLKTDVEDIKKSVEALWEKQDFVRFLETKGIDVHAGVDWMCEVFDILHDDKNNELVDVDRIRALVKADKEGRCVMLPEKLPEHAKRTSVELDCLTNIRKPSGDFLVQPCPFCGSKNIVYWQYRHAAGLRWRIACLHCLAMIDPGWVQEYGYLAELWNTRAEAEAAQEGGDGNVL